MQENKWKAKDFSTKRSFLRKIQRVYLRYVSQVSSYEKERESYPFSPFQYTFKSVIATSIEINLGEVPSIATKVYIFLPARILHLYFMPLIHY